MLHRMERRLPYVVITARGDQQGDRQLYSAECECSWRCEVLDAPHAGGLWDAIVRHTKKCDLIFTDPLVEHGVGRYLSENYADVAASLLKQRPYKIDAFGAFWCEQSPPEHLVGKLHWTNPRLDACDWDPERRLHLWQFWSPNPDTVSEF